MERNWTSPEPRKTRAGKKAKENWLCGVSLTVHNTKYNGKYLSDILKPGCIIAVVADWGDGTEEVAGGASLIGTPATRVPRTPFPSSPMMNFSICRTAKDNAILPPVRAPRPR